MYVTCPKCHNRVHSEFGDCPYCVWKGDAGPGTDLRRILGNGNSTSIADSRSRAYAQWCIAHPGSTQEERKAAYAALP